MRVLLLEDVDNLGYAGDVKNVADGFARNYLIPRRYAEVAAPSIIKKAENIRHQGEEKRKRMSTDALALAERIKGTQLYFERRAGETGKLYGSVTPTDIAEALSKKLELEIDKRKVALSEPIREKGAYDVPIRLMVDVAAEIKVLVNVTPEVAAPEENEEAQPE